MTEKIVKGFNNSSFAKGLRLNLNRMHLKVFKACIESVGYSL